VVLRNQLQTPAAYTCSKLAGEGAAFEPPFLLADGDQGHNVS
jgi:hypothetical protein